MTRCRLRDLCRVNPGVPSWGAIAEDAIVPFLPMEHVWTDRLDMSETRSKGEVASGYTRFAEDDILLPKITPTFEAGRAAIAHALPGGIGAGSTELHVLRPGPEVHPRWLLHFLNNEAFLRCGHADMYGVAGQKRISEEFVKNYPVSRPTLAEQRRTADYLDVETARIDELIAEQETIKHLLDERLSAKRQALIRGPEGEGQPGWKNGRLKSIVRIARGRFTHRPRNDPALYGGDYPFIQTGDIANSRDAVVRTWSQTLNEVGLAASRLAPAGTLVMAIAANIGDVARLGFDACFPDSIVALTPRHQLSDDYVLELVRTLRAELIGRSTLNTQLNINVDRIGEVAVSVPPTREQDAILTELTRMSEYAATVTQEVDRQCELLREHRQTLITAAVTQGIDGLPGMA